MDDDFNTVEAMVVLFELAAETNRTQSAQLAGLLKTLGGVLGLLQRDPASFLQGEASANGLSNEAIDALIDARRAARASKNWAESDRIRDALAAAGVVLEDSAAGTSWRRA